MMDDGCTREHGHSTEIISKDSDAIIITKHLCRIFEMGNNKVCALHNVNVAVKKGEFVAIMGPSGSGKSTLLNHIGLLDTPSEGAVILDRIDTTTLSKEGKTDFRLQKLGFVFQFYNLIGELTALENVYLPRMLLGAHMSECEREALRLLGVVGLKDRAMHIPSELSGGEQQRVAIARALVNQPKILLADEPTANLDTKSAENVVDTFRKLNHETGQTIVMVTHELYLGKKADRIIWLKDGEVSDKQTV